MFETCFLSTPKGGPFPSGAAPACPENPSVSDPTQRMKRIFRDPEIRPIRIRPRTAADSSTSSCTSFERDLDQGHVSLVVHSGSWLNLSRDNPAVTTPLYSIA